MTQSSCEQKEELYIHEWLAILSFLGALILLSLIAFLRADPMPSTTGTPHHLVSPKIEIFIQGAVKNPGMQTVERGTTMAEVLVTADLLPDADLKKIKQGSKLRQGQVIKIPFQKISKGSPGGKTKRKRGLGTGQK